VERTAEEAPRNALSITHSPSIEVDSLVYYNKPSEINNKKNRSMHKKWPMK